MSDEFTPGREPVQIVEIRQPRCKNVYGSSPCTASGGPDVKCYNTFGTCQDPSNFNSSPVDLLGTGGVSWVYGNVFVSGELSATEQHIYGN